MSTLSLAQPEWDWDYIPRPNEHWQESLCNALFPSDEGVIAIGQAWGGDAGHIVMVIHLDDFGEVIDSISFDHPGYAGAEFSARSDDGGYILASGRTYFKISADDELVWSRTSPQEGYPAFAGLVKDGDEYVVAAGRNGAGGYRYDIFCFKFNEDGDVVWQRAYGAGRDYVNCIAKHPQGGYVLSAISINGNDEDVEYYLLHIGDNGDSLGVLGRSFGADQILTFPDFMMLRSWSGIRIVDYQDSLLWTIGIDLSYYNQRFVRVIPDDMIIPRGGGGLLTGYAFNVDGNHLEEDITVFLLRFNDQGEMLWHRSTSAGGRVPSFITNVVQAFDNTYFVGGHFAMRFWVGHTTADPNAVTDEIVPAIPQAFLVSPAYPNPFNGVTVIPIEILRPISVSYSVTDITGVSIVRSRENLRQGQHTLHLDSSNLTSGTYFVNFNGMGLSQTIPITVIK